MLGDPIQPGRRLLSGRRHGAKQADLLPGGHTLVVTATRGSGGTWAGATEALRNHWGQVSARSSRDSPALHELERAGAHRLPEILPEEIDTATLDAWASGSAPPSAGSDLVKRMQETLQATPFGMPEVVEKGRTTKSKAKRRKKPA